jgi:ribosomal protein S21
MEFKVKNNDVESAIRRWKQWLKRDGILKEIKQRRYHVTKNRKRYLKRRYGRTEGK